MSKKDLEAIVSFAEANGMMSWAFVDVLNEYLTTKEVAESYENFSYFAKPITEISDTELIYWYVLFLNGANYDVEYKAFKAECANRGKEFNEVVDYLTSTL